MKQVNGMKLYSTAEVAEMLSVSKRFVLNKIGKGVLPGVRISRGYFISEESLSNFLNGKTQDKTNQKREEPES